MQFVEAAVLVFYYAFPIVVIVTAMLTRSLSATWRSRLIAVALVVWSAAWLIRSAAQSWSRIDVPDSQWIAAVLVVGAVNALAIAAALIALIRPDSAERGHGVLALARRKSLCALLIAVAAGYVATFFLLPIWE